jgi:hypothetical protein
MKRFGQWIVAAASMLALAVNADVVSWTNASSGYWTNAANWSGGAVPGSGDDVVFSNGSATATIDGNVTINSLNMTGTYAGKITFAQGLSANLAINNDLYMGPTASIDAPYSSTNGNGTGRTITVGGNATILGKINADTYGFPSYGDGATLYHGPGYDGDNKWGAAHGGRSGNGSAAPYGSLTQPTELGSGAYGSRGGGAIKLDVTGSLTVNGRITADAAAGFHTGSGGSVWLLCDALSGTGTVSATAASGGGGGAGGGGRIAFQYNTGAFTGLLRASGSTAEPAQLGTLWDPNHFAATGAITINGDRYNYLASTNTTDCSWGLTLTNSAVVCLRGFTNGVLTLTNLVVSGGSTLRFDVDIAGTSLKRGLNNIAFARPAVSVLGASTLGLSAQTYTCSTFNVSSGSFVYTSVGDTNAINADSGGTAGNPHGAGITFYCDTATINGLLEASGTGFRVTTGPGAATKTWDGGSYGGMGAGQGSAPIAPCYGSLTRPTALGSGARHDVTMQYFAGGAIMLVATNGMVVNGVIRANGQSSGAGGSSGGSIWLVASTLAGNGLISAAGGNGVDSSPTTSYGAGGGGRIAMDYVSSTFAGTVSVARGTSTGSAYPARTGTLFQVQSPYPGACSLGYGGLSLNTTYSDRTNTLKIVRQVATWLPLVPSVVWTDTSTDFAGNVRPNIATYTLSGMPPDTGLEILTNSVSMLITNSGPSGSITFSVALNGPRTVSVALGGMPTADTLAPSNVTTTSAYLNGSLTSTGWYDTASLVFWGPTDGGFDAGAWSNVCVFPAPQSMGPFSTNVSLPTTGEYFYRCAASNESGLAWAGGQSQYLLAGVTIAVTPETIGERFDTANFWVSRDSMATSRAVTVSFQVDGTATNLVDYTRSLASSITLAAGVSSGAVQVVSLPDALLEPDESMIVTLTAAPTDLYGVGTPGTDTLSITDCPPGQITWISPTSGYWTNAANWTGGVVPMAGDDVFLDSGSATVTIDGELTVNSLTVNGTYSGTITFKEGAAGNLTVNNDLYLQSGARIVPTYASLVGVGVGRTITVLGDATIAGNIDGNGCGFLRNDTNPGFQGPGFNILNIWSAAHGGLGLPIRQNGAPIYGSVTQPTSLGSGNHNGRGGGAVKLKVNGTLTVEGTISADADNASYAAAGGSIWLDCGTLAGGGAIHADSVGGSVYPGGGGRVAITCNTRTYTGTVSIRGTGVGQPGSLWDPALFAIPSGTVTLNNAQYQYFFPPSTPSYTWALTVTNGANVFFHDFTNGVLSLSSLVVSGGSKLRFDVDNAGTLQKGGINRLAMPYTPLSVVGSSTLALPSLTYTCSTLAVGAGSIVYLAQADTSVTNEDSGGTAGKPHGVGAVLYCDSASIDGVLDASLAGFPATMGPGGTAMTWDGGGYGGQGGGQANPPTAPSYGSMTRPSALGSGGSQPGAVHYGGGAVKVVVTNALTVNGAIRADGGTDNAYIGDSGGSIWLIAGTLSGTGVVSAVGGNGNLTGSHGAGGGGRIAIEYVTSAFSGSVTVANGFAASSAYPARTGTLFQCQSPVPGACSLGFGGMQLNSSYSVSSNNVKVTRSVAKWNTLQPRIVWTDASTRFDGTALSNTATYAVTGLQPNTRAFVYVDDAPMLSTNVPSGGNLTFSVSLTAPRTIRVEGPPSGTMIMIR